MVSQRPSELDIGILSQCNTVFAFRMTSLKDQEFVRGIVTDNAYGLLDFLPSLGDAEAIVAGQAVAVPMRVRLAELPPEAQPRSASASFSQAWRSESQGEAFIADVVQRWRAQTR
jgi:DNA helicase HerA-like ATPase